MPTQQPKVTWLNLVSALVIYAYRVIRTPVNERAVVLARLSPDKSPKPVVSPVVLRSEGPGGHIVHDAISADPRPLLLEQLKCGYGWVPGAKHCLESLQRALADHLAGSDPLRVRQVRADCHFRLEVAISARQDAGHQANTTVSCTWDITPVTYQ